MALDIERTCSVAITDMGEARFASDKLVVWTSGEGVYVQTPGGDPQLDPEAPHTARALRWLAAAMLGEPLS